MVNRLWFKRRFRFLRYHVLRVSTVTMSGDIRAGIDFIALLKFGDTGTHCLDNTGNVPARNKWNRASGGGHLRTGALPARHSCELALLSCFPFRNLLGQDIMFFKARVGLTEPATPTGAQRKRGLQF